MSQFVRRGAPPLAYAPSSCANPELAEILTAEFGRAVTESRRRARQIGFAFEPTQPPTPLQCLAEAARARRDARRARINAEQDEALAEDE